MSGSTKPCLPKGLKELTNRPKLNLGRVDDPDGVGVGYLQISKSEFASWQPQLMAHAAVTPEELEGYNLWKESNGGLFGRP